MDVGSFDDLHSASNFVKNVEERQSYKIGCLEEIAYNNGWIKKFNILKRIEKFKNSNYSKYLKNIVIRLAMNPKHAVVCIHLNKTNLLSSMLS